MTEVSAERIRAAAALMALWACASASAQLRLQGTPEPAGLQPAAPVRRSAYLQLGLDSVLVATSNADLGGPRSGQSDTILGVIPRIELYREGERLRVKGRAALNGLLYANGTQDNSILPDVDLEARLAAIERFLFLEA